MNLTNQQIIDEVGKIILENLNLAEQFTDSIKEYETALDIAPELTQIIGVSIRMAYRSLELVNRCLAVLGSNVKEEQKLMISNIEGPIRQKLYEYTKRYGLC